MRERIIQISDIHFGEKNFSVDLKNNLLVQLGNENPDLIIVSGDLTNSGYTLMNMNRLQNLWIS